jgi:hypothetical protein
MVKAFTLLFLRLYDLLPSDGLQGKVTMTLGDSITPPSHIYKHKELSIKYNLFKY